VYARNARTANEWFTQGRTEQQYTNDSTSNVYGNAQGGTVPGPAGPPSNVNAAEGGGVLNSWFVDEPKKPVETRPSEERADQQPQQTQPQNTQPQKQPNSVPFIVPAVSIGRPNQSPPPARPQSLAKPAQNAAGVNRLTQAMRRVVNNAGHPNAVPSQPSRHDYVPPPAAPTHKAGSLQEQMAALQAGGRLSKKSQEEEEDMKRRLDEMTGLSSGNKDQES
jgi:hypothetical protein